MLSRSLTLIQPRGRWQCVFVLQVLLMWRTYTFKCICLRTQVCLFQIQSLLNWWLLLQCGTFFLNQFYILFPPSYLFNQHLVSTVLKKTYLPSSKYGENRRILYDHAHKWLDQLVWLWIFQGCQLKMQMCSSLPSTVPTAYEGMNRDYWLKRDRCAHSLSQANMCQPRDAVYLQKALLTW